MLARQVMQVAKLVSRGLGFLLGTGPRIHRKEAVDRVYLGHGLRALNFRKLYRVSSLRLWGAQDSNISLFHLMFL